MTDSDIQKLIEIQFKKAEYFIKNSLLQKKLDDKEKLCYYKYFKQATMGDIQESRPSGFLKYKEQVKWDAWNSVKGMSKYDAMQNYINLISESDQNWEKHDGLKNLIL